MTANSINKSLVFIILLGLIMSCMRADKSVDEVTFKRVWPAAPEQPRVVFENAFANAEELGIGKGFWRWLAELFTGSEEFQMVRPMAVVTSSQGVIYVADPGIKGIHRFDTKDHEYHLIRRKDERLLPSPVSLVMNSQDEVFLADSQLAQLFKISPGDEYATPVKLNETLKQPTGLAINQQNDQLAVVDTARHKVLLFNSQGKLIKSFGQRGLEKAQFNFPTMMWRHRDGKLLVTDSLNFRIQTFDAEGQYLAQFGQLGNASGYHARPKGVATDKEGRVYVVDSLFHNVQMFDASGQFLMAFGEQGRAKGQFWLPTGIFIDNEQRIYVADSHNRRIQVFRYIGDE